MPDGQPVTMKFKPGSHVLTMVDPSQAERPVIMLSWAEARLMADLFAIPQGATCQVPLHECLPCGLRQELLAMIAERGPR